MESLTHALARKARKIIEEVEKLGGMTSAIEAGMPKLRIEESRGAAPGAHRSRRRRHRRGQQVPARRSEDEIDMLDIDNAAVRESQIARLKKLRAKRDAARSRPRSPALTQVPRRTVRATCSRPAIEAARARATVGEISDALEEVLTRYRAEIRSIWGCMARCSTTTTS